jgi:dienelactone hydrolase
VLLLGGSGGGLSDPATAALLASRGYPVLQLAYFGLPGLPAELKRIPLEYLERALRWLAARPEVDPERVIVVGSSRGAELGLLLGARFTSLVHGVAAYAPSSVVNPGFPSGLTDCPPAWTYEGTPIPHVTCDEYLEPRPTRPPESVIPVERIRGPILLVAGGDDTLWPSAGYTAAIVDRLRANDRSDFGTVVYRRAGHGAGATIPYLPLPTTYCTPSGSCSNLGGDTTADARARTTAWFRLREILARLRR